MNDVLFARAQMGMSLAFHIIFAAIGIGLPLLMVISEGLYLRTHQAIYQTISKRWSRGTALLFAIGAVSGTVLSFELGLLWPNFMKYAGPIIGMPFSLEGFAFFTEAIFLGLYLYGWQRLSPIAHWLSGVVVAISGAASGLFVITANSWMNTPTGFDIINGQVTNVDTIAAMRNPAAAHEVIHMLLAAYVATGFAAAAIHSYFVLRDRNQLFHRRALAITLTVASISVPLQLASGDLSAKQVAHLQPVKFAALEALYHTIEGAPLHIGGIPDDSTLTNQFAIELPKALSFLAFDDFNAKVLGLEAFPRDLWPNTRIVHWSFDIMVGSGIVMFIVALWAGVLWLRRRKLPENRWFLRAVVACGPLGFIAIETGWTVTEVGRQPWIVYGIMKTVDAVTPLTGLVVPFVTFTLLYIFLTIILIISLRRLFLATAQPAADGQVDTRTEINHG